MSEAEKIKSIIAQGEGLEIEFKESYDTLPRNVFESICAFLNRKGGHILLGVTNDGDIEGVKESSVQEQLDTLARDMNNPQIISPTFYLGTEVVDIEGKKIIYVYVPESSQPHAYKGVIYDRNQDGDFKLTNQNLITNLYLRKQDGYTENKVFPFLRLEDFELGLFDMVRNYVVQIRPDHPWRNMANEEILRSARMYLRDIHTGKEGYTLAAALMFGKESTIASALPHYKTDALCRKEDTMRYDDRDVIRCNLIEAYSRLLAFVRKHTPDRFYQEGIQRLSIREIIFREAIANLLVHREFSNPYPATLTIYKNTVVTQNWNRPFMTGRITPDNLQPHPKNPTISDFFRQLGWVEDLGSGVRKMFQYCPIYVKGALPLIEEGDVFKVTIPYEKSTDIKTDLPVSISIPSVGSNTDKILVLLKENPKFTAAEMAALLSIAQRTVERILAKLTEDNVIKREGSDKTGQWTIIHPKIN